MSKADLSVNMNESVLRLQGSVTDQDSLEYRSSRTEEPFQELNRKSANLKKILSRIPDEITDRKTFLETIKEIVIHCRGVRCPVEAKGVGYGRVKL